MIRLAKWIKWELNLLPKLEKVSDLIYYDNPYLSHFKSDEGEDYIFYFCESDEEASRWLVFRVSSDTLNAYMERLVPLDKLISSSSNAFIYELDKRAEHRSAWIGHHSILPRAYVPPTGLYYIGGVRASPKDVELVSSKQGTPVMLLHLAGGASQGGIGYGTAAVVKFATLLGQLHAVTFSLAREQAEIFARRIADKTRRTLLKFQEENFTLQLARVEASASMNVLLTPIVTELQMLGAFEFENNVMRSLVSLINDTINTENIDEQFYSRYDYKTVDELAALLGFLDSSRIGIDFSWGNALESEVRSQTAKVSPSVAGKLYAKLTEREVLHRTELVFEGMFREIDGETRHYKFIANGGDKSTGYIHASMKESIPGLAVLKPRYKVTINREVTKRKAREESETVDSIMDIQDLSGEWSATFSFPTEP